MPTLVSTQTFSNGNVLNADALTNHVVDATPLATFISGQTAVAAPAPADEFLIATAGASPAKKVNFSTLAANLPTGTTAVDLAVTGTTTLSGDLNANGNTIIGNASTDTLTVNATSNLSNTTIGSAAIEGTWSRTGTTAIITKAGHGLTTGDSRYFSFSSNVIGNNRGNLLNGTRTVTVTNSSTFEVTVPDIPNPTPSSTTGIVRWYEKSLTLNSTLTGSLQGDVLVNVAGVELATGDEFLIRDASNLFRLKTVSTATLFFPRSFGAIPLHLASPLIVNGTGTRTAPSTTVNVSSVAHGMRTGDVLYIPAVAGTPAFVAGWYAATRIDDDNFSITTAAATTGSWNLSWFPVVIPATNNEGNVYSAFYNNVASGATAVHVNFNVAAPNSSYCLNLTVTTGLTNSTRVMPICGIGASGSTGLSASLLKTVNGFGVGVLTYDGGASPSLAGSLLNFTALW